MARIVGRRPDYYRLLNEVRRTGDWEGWTVFCLEGVAEIAEESATAARDLYRLVARDRERVLTAKRSSLTAVRLLELLPRRPVVMIPRVVEMLETTKPTATKSVALLESRSGSCGTRPGGSETARTGTRVISTGCASGTSSSRGVAANHAGGVPAFRPGAAAAGCLLTSARTSPSAIGPGRARGRFGKQPEARSDGK